LLTANEKTNQSVPGGNGVLKPKERNGILYAERNIYLGKNVRNYQ